MKMKGIIVIDVTRCLGCKSCEIECAVAHSKSKNLIKTIKEEAHIHPRVRVEEIKGVAIPLRCAHCEAAPCVAICPTEAISKKGMEGPIVIDQNLCVGCRFCIVVCPYGIPQLKCDGKVITKCDLCFKRLEEGELPACVIACPTGALKFVEISEGEPEKSFISTFIKRE